VNGADRSEHDLPWDPYVRGTLVRDIDNAARQGYTTGRTRGGVPHLYVHVDFGPNNRSFVPYLSLEVVADQLEPEELFAERSFARPRDLNQLLTWTKLSSDLTTVFYSMEGNNTEFMPHQFKPVLSFIESIEGRLLIADEVGLGKTIESIYIWRELQSRSDARRLLIVCPSMLTRKWQGDLRVRFGIRSRIVKASELHDEIETAEKNRTDDGFALVTSLEGIRVRDESVHDDPVDSRKRFARFLEEAFQSYRDRVFDLVIVDEAHYLRNPNTASHQTVQRIRDRSANLVFLSATPIQTGDKNLFYLLNLMAPEVFYDYDSFAQLIEDNRAIVKATSFLRAGVPQPEILLSLLKEIRNGVSFRDDGEIAHLENYLNDYRSLNIEQAMFWARRLERKNLFSSFISRTRKRDVYAERSIRSAQTLYVPFDPVEEEIYQKVTKAIRARAVQTDKQTEQFTLLIRQRQMSSSMVAALESWRGNESMEEILWDDLGFFDDNGSETEDDYRVGDEFGELWNREEIQELEETDSKYRELRLAIDSLLSEDPAEKIVIFAFFRLTLSYLHRRLEHDGIRSIQLKGGTGDDRFDVIDTFREPEGPSVLLSSEVGSEGIDLQFARVVINYDLPWNPMRVEQRIGRIDRIGQKADRIVILNMAREGSVDDRIVMRLYERIGVFENSIGDLEPIMGSVVDSLISDYLDASLTDLEREERIEQQLRALEVKRQEIENLEKNAFQLMGFTDYLTNAAQYARENGRWIRPDDLSSFVTAFLSGRYVGSSFGFDEEDRGDLLLSSEAQRDLGDWIARRRPQQATRLHRASRPVSIRFSIKTDSVSKRAEDEFVNVTHPLVQWAIETLSEDPKSFHRCFAAEIASIPGVQPGVYLVGVERWQAIGFRKERTLAHSGRNRSDEEISPESVEALVNTVAERGQPWYDASGIEESIDEVMQRVLDDLEVRFYHFEKDFRIGNEAICDQQLRSVEQTFQRKRQRQQELIENYQREVTRGRKNFIGLVNARKVQLEKDEREAREQRDRIAAARSSNIDSELVCVGVVRVTE
jgi:superfamily II DNA or RNA helicase